jgi:hypothetical protein
MALINITGGRYANQALSAVGTTTVTIATATFVAADFNPTQRMVALHTSAGAFKGIAWVRRFVSTTSLELENRFVDPVTGLFATQVVGDILMVSRNASETPNNADWVVSGVPLSVTTNDALTFGTTNTNMSVCFYEENMDFNTRSHIRVVGGVVVFGKLMSYDGVSKESFLWSRECNVKPRADYLGGGSGGGNAVQFNVFAIGTTAGHAFMFGGMVGGTYQSSNFIGSEGLTGLAAGSFAFYGTRMNYGCSSPSNGGNWPSNPTRHLLYKTIHEARYNNANLVIWGNGAFEGSYLAFPQIGTGTPLGIFRANAVYNVGAAANNRTIVSDLGSGTFIDAINGGDYRFTNVITPAITVSRYPGSARPIQFSFSDDYTNLRNRTTLVIQRGDGAIATSVVNTANSRFTATVLQSTYSATANGAATQTAFYTTFNYTVKCYGFNVVNGTHSTYTYPLGTAGNGTDLKLGGLINQLADTNVTLSETAALALSSKFSINPTTRVITVSANATYDELYDYVVAWNCSSAANAVLPNLSQYVLTANGLRITAFTGWSLVVNTAVTVSAGAKFSESYFDTITLNGTGQITAVYATLAGVSTVLELNPPSNGYSLCIFRANGTTKYFQSNVNAGSYYVYFAPSEAGTYFLAAEKYGQKRTEDTLVLNGGNVWYNITDSEDVGITDNFATASAYTTLSTTSQIYDATAVFRLTETGIKLGQLVARDGLYLDFGNNNVKIKDDATAIVAVASGIITYKSIVINESDKYNAMKATPPKTITPTDTEQINVLIEDANGDSLLVIAGGDNLGYELWKVPSSAPVDVDPTTGTLLTTLATYDESYRFIGISGFDIIGVDLSSGVKRRSSMLKGSYKQEFYVGNQIQLDSQAIPLLQVIDLINYLQLKIDTDLDVKVSTRATLAQIEASTVLAQEATSQDIKTIADALPTLTEIEASTVLSKETTLQSVKTTVEALTNYDDTILQGKVDAIKTKVDTLQNTDTSRLLTKAFFIALNK